MRTSKEYYDYARTSKVFIYIIKISLRNCRKNSLGFFLAEVKKVVFFFILNLFLIIKDIVGLVIKSMWRCIAMTDDKYSIRSEMNTMKCTDNRCII